VAFVIDNSVVCGWIIRSQSTPYSEAISQRLYSESAIAPALLVLEYANVLRTACRRGKLTAIDAQRAIDALGRLPIRVDCTAANPAQLLALALRFNLSTYDAWEPLCKCAEVLSVLCECQGGHTQSFPWYLDLALREGAPIATQDVALAEAARYAGVGIVAATSLN
jgi:predicted nucleic acid-binding protein